MPAGGNVTCDSRRSTSVSRRVKLDWIAMRKVATTVTIDSPEIEHTSTMNRV